MKEFKFNLESEAHEKYLRDAINYKANEEAKRILKDEKSKLTD